MLLSKPRWVLRISQHWEHVHKTIHSPRGSPLSWEAPVHIPITPIVEPRPPSWMPSVIHSSVPSSDVEILLEDVRNVTGRSKRRHTSVHWMFPSPVMLTVPLILRIGCPRAGTSPSTWIVGRSGHSGRLSEVRTTRMIMGMTRTASVREALVNLLSCFVC